LKEGFSPIKINKKQEISVQSERGHLARKSVKQSENGRMAALAFKIHFKRERVARSPAKPRMLCGQDARAPTEQYLFNGLFCFNQTLIMA